MARGEGVSGLWTRIIREQARQAVMEIQGRIRLGPDELKFFMDLLATGREHFAVPAHQPLKQPIPAEAALRLHLFPNPPRTG